MKRRLALVTILSAVLLAAVGATPASPADPENFRTSLTVTVISCEGGNLPQCRFEGSAVVPQLGPVTIAGSIIKGCVVPLFFCIWDFNATLTPSGGHGGRILALGGQVQWDLDQPAPTAVPWEANNELDYAGQGTATDDFTYQLPYGSQFTINLTGTLKPVH